jgi:L-asparaginase II
VIAKGGAEGVLVMGTPDGHAVALKILDGSLRAATLVATELLATAGLVDRSAADRVIEATTPRVLGGGIPVGSIRAAF